MPPLLPEAGSPPTVDPEAPVAPARIPPTCWLDGDEEAPTRFEEPPPPLELTTVEVPLSVLSFWMIVGEEAITVSSLFLAIIDRPARE